MSTTPNMLLLLPIPTVTIGPTYASENNIAFATIDSHDHTTGKGVPIPSNGLNINNDLPFNGFNATQFRSVRFTSQSAPLSLPADLSSLYVSQGNLFYNNSTGQQVQITSGAALDATSIGGIGGDYATSTALEFYTSLSSTFTFWSANNVPANIDTGAITIRQVTTSPHGITIQSPNSLAANYSLTLPGALPPSSAAVTVNSSGQLSFISGGSIPVGGITMYGGAAAPSGFLLCDGSAISRTTYVNLFTAIGTAYGIGDGSTTFNIPDLRGLFPRGVSGSSGNDPDASSRTATNGGNSGNNVGSVQADQLVSHDHTWTNNAAAGGSVININAQQGNNGANNVTVSTSNFGGNETRPKNVYVNFIIKT